MLSEALAYAFGARANEASVVHVQLSVGAYVHLGASGAVSFDDDGRRVVIEVVDVDGQWSEN